MSWGDLTKSNGMNYDDSLARKVQISTMTWDSCPNPILTPEWFFDTSTYFNNGWEWCGSTNWCGYIHHSCRGKKTSGMGATDTVTLRFRYPVWFGECSQRSPPQKKCYKRLAHPSKQTEVLIIRGWLQIFLVDAWWCTLKQRSLDL